MSRLDRVALAKQAAMGTKQPVMEYTVPVESCEPRLQRTEMTREETVGHKFPTDLEYGARFWEVAMAGACRINSLPRILSGFMGPATTTTPGGGTTSRKHAFDPVGKTLVPHSLDVARIDVNPDVNDLFWDAIGNELSLAVTPNDFVNFDAGWIARDLDQAAAVPAGTYDLSQRFAFHKVQAFLSLNGAAETALELERFELRYSNGVDTDQLRLGSRSLYKVQEGNVSADISFTPKTALDVHYRRAIADTDPDNVKIRLLATGPIIEAAIAYQIEIIVHRCHYVEAPLPVDAGNTLDEIAVRARCAYDSAAAKFVDVNVTNNVATY